MEIQEVQFSNNEMSTLYLIFQKIYCCTLQPPLTKTIFVTWQENPNEEGVSSEKDTSQQVKTALVWLVVVRLLRRI